MILIIAEKPSLARNITAAIGNMSRRDGYFEGNGYIVSWALGHLFQLYDVEDYLGVTEQKWTVQGLPFYPEDFRFKLRTKGKERAVDEGVRRQFEIIEKLCNRSDVERIINAGDADREGEIIIRLCIKNALKTEKPLGRLWLPDQTEQTVKKELSECRPESDYDNLSDEGFSRMYVDWLYGINLSRYAMLRSGKLLRVGRVIIPIVKAIYDRDMAIKNFVPQKYYGIVSKTECNGGEIELVSERKYRPENLEKAKRCAAAYNSVPTVVTGKSSKKCTLNPPKLFSLSKLQSLLGKKYKMSMDTSLSIVQKLYEAGYVTYPRTNSEYLATAEKDKIRQIVSAVSKLGYPVCFKDKKTIFDDVKVESHSALTPTYKIPDKAKLSEDELKVYTVVFKRFVAVFCSEECVAAKTEMTLKTGEYEEFSLKGTVILEKGWTKYDDPPQKDKTLPELKKDDTVVTDFAPKEKETAPPKHYTIETLNNFLKNPFREEKAAIKDDGDDAEEYKAMFEGVEIGTEATRTAIIGNAEQSGYIELKSNTYYILDGGIYLIETLRRLGINMEKEKTAHLGKALKSVFHGDMTVDGCIDIAKSEINEILRHTDVTAEEDTDIGFAGDTVGTCPLCKNEVIRGRYGYVCRGFKDGCGFKISLEICRRTIPLSAAKALLQSGSTAKLKGFVSKSGKPFDAKLKLSDGKAVFDFDN